MEHPVQCPNCENDEDFVLLEDVSRSVTQLEKEEGGPYSLQVTSDVHYENTKLTCADCWEEIPEDEFEFRDIIF